MVLFLFAQLARLAWCQQGITVASQSDFNHILNVNIQCAPYKLPEIDDLMRKTKFPPVGQIASIPEGDTNAQDAFDNILKSGIIPPDVPVKEDNDDNHASVNQDGYNATDPDCWYSATQCTKPKHQNLTMDLTTCPTPSTLGFTVSDGPNCSHNALYDSFVQNGIKATLFFVGSNVIQYPYQAQRGVTDGHDICVQSWSNPYLTTLPNDQVFSELYYTALSIKAVLGVTPTCWRPPFGDVDDRVRAIAYGLGLRTIMYAADAKTSSKGYDQVAGMESSSSPIVQLHETSNATMSSIISHLPALKRAYQLVLPVTACMNITHPYTEDIVYPNFLQAQKPYFNYGNLPKNTTITADATPEYEVKSLHEMDYGFANSLNATGVNATFPAKTDASNSAASLAPGPFLASLVVAVNMLAATQSS